MRFFEHTEEKEVGDISSMRFGFKSIVMLRVHRKYGLQRVDAVRYLISARMHDFPGEQIVAK